MLEKLNAGSFEAYIVGGCVRDLILKTRPKDWDVTTNAAPEDIQKIFPKSFYENKFFTVGVQIPKPVLQAGTLVAEEGDLGAESKDSALKVIEITTFRSETKYTDKRHPDEVKAAKTLEEDLARRDFTVNALALSIEKTTQKIIDPFDGQRDLRNKTIRAVGNPDDRFFEDALRMMRAVRFMTALGEQWKIEDKTEKAIEKNAGLLRMISKERIKDELEKIITAPRAADGIETLRKLSLLKYIIPELEEGYGVGQNKHHIYDCYTHNLLALKYAAERNFSKEVRIASLLHDIAKPRVKQGEGPDSTFYNHEVVGARMAAQILTRLRFSQKTIEKIARLVRYHLFYYNVDEVTEASVRRLVGRVGPENMQELLQVRMADRIGSGVPKAEPYKLRHLQYVIERVSSDPISAKMLKVGGNDVMRILKVQPGPKIGRILDIILENILSDPEKNKKGWLENEIKRLGSLPDNQLSAMAEKARKVKEELEIKKDTMTKKKYWVT